MKHIDNFLNSITMYRLVLYGLFVLAVLGIGFGFTDVLPLNGWYMLSSLVVLIAVSALSNIALGKIFKIPINAESSYITALILFLILPPASDLQSQIIIALVALVAMASKFVLNIRGKHIFNPVAIAVVLVGLTGLVLPTWWVGSAVLLIPVTVLGLLMARKVRRYDIFFAYAVVAVIGIVLTNMNYGGTLISSFIGAFKSWPLMFFGTIMLTEPLTTPPSRKLRIAYGALVGLLFAIPFQIGTLLYSTPELALVIGNIFSYIVSPKQRLVLRLKEKLQLAPMVYDFIFSPNRPMPFTAGQYMDWTIDAPKNDTRGNRRYFTIASAPSETDIHLGVKVATESSTFKQALLAMQPGQEMMAGTLSGDFILPKDTKKKLVAIAGGVGITPFRSMIKHMLNTNEHRDIVLFYLATDPAEFVYKDVLEEASRVGVKVVYLTGYITAEVILKEVPEYKERVYYISGPPGMVQAYKKLLTSLGVSLTAIKTDYFSGY